MAIGTAEIGFPVNMTASGQVAGGTSMARTQLAGNAASGQAETTALQGAILGFYVNSTSSGTIALTKGTSGGGAAITGTITPAVGWSYLPIVSDTGIYATIGGTINVTFVVLE